MGTRHWDNDDQLVLDSGKDLVGGHNDGGPVLAGFTSLSRYFQRLGDARSDRLKFGLCSCLCPADLAGDRNHHLQIALELRFGSAGPDDHPGVCQGEAQAVGGGKAVGAVFQIIHAHHIAAAQGCGRVGT